MQDSSVVLKGPFWARECGLLGQRVLLLEALTVCWEFGAVTASTPTLFLKKLQEWKQLFTAEERKRVNILITFTDAFRERAMKHYK